MKFLQHAILISMAIIIVIVLIYGIYEIGLFQCMVVFTIGIAVISVLSILSLSNSIVMTITCIIGSVILISLMIMNPITLGIGIALLPTIVTLFILAILDAILPLPNVVLMILSFVLSYPLMLVFEFLVDAFIEDDEGAALIFIDVLFFIFSIFMIGLWIKVVIISPERTQIEGSDVETSVLEGRVKRSGGIDEDGLWQLYTNGYLEFHGNDLYDYEEFLMPWDNYKDEILYINMDDSVKIIRNRWFLNYKNLKTVSLPANLEYVSEKAFQGCCNLEKFFISDSNPNYCCEEGVLLSKDKKELVLCPNTKVDLYIPTAIYEENWYADLLSDKKLLYGCTQWNTDKPELYYSRNFKGYALKDIDQDGIAELFLTTNIHPGMDDTILMVCVDQEGKVHCPRAIDTSTGGFYSVGEKCLVSHVKIAGVEHVMIEEYSNGTVNLLYDLYCMNEDSGPKMVYYSGENAIQESEYEKLLKMYVDRSEQILYTEMETE